MDWFTAIELMGAIPNPGQAIADIRTLYAVYQGAKEGDFSIAATAKAGTLSSEVAALARTATLLETLLADKTHGPQLTAFLASLS